MPAPFYTGIAFDENGEPIPARPAGSFNFSQYDIPTRAESPQATIVTESFDPYQRQVEQQQAAEKSRAEFQQRNPATESSITLQMGQPAPGSTSDQFGDATGEIDVRAAQFKGMDMYRKLRSGGASHEEAIMRAAPMLYASSPSQFVKAMTPPTVKPAVDMTAPRAVPQYDESGKLLGHSLVDSSGRQKSFVRDVPPTDRLSVSDSITKQNLLAERQALNQQLGAIVRNPMAAFDPKSEQKITEIQGKIDDNIKKVEEIANKYIRDTQARDSGPAAAATTAPPAPAAPVNEVIRKTKSGRQAVFDAATKQFLRYAN